MAKVHMEAGPFGLASCGKSNVDTTRKVSEVTCKRCRGTDAFHKERQAQRAVRAKTKIRTP
jgi:hypothetical protein